ncbi:MAG: hypothetical protein ACI8RZ_003787 [Myxococcota bacterium]|jgi:hypothetical protein
MRWLPIILATSLIACGDKDDGSDTGPSSSDSGADTTEPQTETDCEDGTDNDEDGVADCLDDDCAAAFACNYPQNILHRTNIAFDGYLVECETWIGTFDEQVDDCSTRLSSPLVVATKGNLCAECDLTFTGQFTYDFDDCDDLTGDSARPTEGWFGFVFIDESTRELWSQDDAGTWSKAITMTKTGGVWEHSDSGEVVENVDDCDNSPLTLGNLTVTLTFEDQ